MSAKNKGPLKVLCPCGYSKQIPSKFNGKKVVCPKCRKVLTVIRLERARLLSQCPYCQKVQVFNPKVDTCDSCDCAFRPPKLIEALETKIAAAASSPAPDVGESGVDLRPEFQFEAGPAVRSSIAQPRKKSVLMPLLMTISLMFTSILVAWAALGDQLGLPKLGEVLGIAQKQPAATTRANELPRATVDEPAAIDEPKTAVVPELLSPSIEILGGKWMVDQTLDRESSEVLGLTTIIDIKLKNLTDRHITNIAFRVSCLNQHGRRTKFNIDNIKFSRGLGPRAVGQISLDCDPGNWKTIEVSIVKVEAGDQSDPTLIGPFVVSNDDREVGPPDDR